MARNFFFIIVFCVGWLGFIPAVMSSVVHSRDHSFVVETVVDDLNRPWGMTFLPDQSMLITLRGGQLVWVSQDGQRQTEPVGGLPDIYAQGQGGLLDVALHPDGHYNRWVYVSLVAGTATRNSTELWRGQWNAEDKVLENTEQLFVSEPKLNNGLHFGSRIAFDQDGYVYVSLGERYRMNMAQDTANHLGSVIRLHDDGRIPEDNPFVKSRSGRPEIFSFGHRNVQGLVYDAQHDRLWAHEHGPKGGDELNILKAGVNYGWPEITYGIDYSGEIISHDTHRQGMAQPVAYWVPSIAPCGMTLYNGTQFPQWQGNLFIGALVQQHLRRVVLDGERVLEQEVLLKDLNERIRDVETGPDGYVYLLTDHSQGRLLRLRPVGD
jgi:glucose/arabinose dehydrogenase